MKVLSIETGREAVKLYTDFDGPVMVRESVPTIGVKPGRTLSLVDAVAENGVITLARRENANDRMNSRFTVYVNGKEVEGVCYVTDVAPEAQWDVSEYPTPPIIKVLGGSREFRDSLNIRQGLMNVNLPNLMTVFPGEDTIPHEYNGRIYYFRKKAVEDVDRATSSIELMTMILLNSPRLFGSTGEKALLEACIHPGFDWESPDAFISAFDMQTEEGQGYFGAFVDFLAQRYTRPDKKYGHLGGFIVSNEVCSQYVWGNAGEMPVEQYVREYTQALRMAWLAGRRYCSHFRAYISLDQYWDGACHNPRFPQRYYPGRRVIELLNENATRDGNFGWGVAYHPYPEDLSYPDFWNDRAPNFTFSTPKITFKNMEMLEAFLSQEAYQYNGKPRRIIFSEQGFNSRNGELQKLTEKQAAAGYVLAYMKARNLKTLDLFTHHSYIDNPHEFGLNLGVFRYDPEKPDHKGEPKPIFESVKAMDTPDEPAVVEKARAFIGEDLFDYLLNPPILYGERDKSQDNAFGGGAAGEKKK